MWASGSQSPLYKNPSRHGAKIYPFTTRSTSPRANPTRSKTHTWPQPLEQELPPKSSNADTSASKMRSPAGGAAINYHWCQQVGNYIKPAFSQVDTYATPPCKGSCTLILPVHPHERSTQIGTVQEARRARGSGGQKIADVSRGPCQNKAAAPLSPSKKRLESRSAPNVVLPWNGPYARGRSGSRSARISLSDLVRPR